MKTRIEIEVRSEPNFEKLADAFYASWNADVRPSLDQFLQKVDEHFHERLLEYLLPIDIEYRAKAGETLNADDYAAFGDSAKEINRGQAFLGTRFLNLLAISSIQSN